VTAAQGHGKGPYLILAAFWQEDDNTDAVAEAVKQERFPRPPGYSAGAVVAFRREVADSPGFRRDLGRFDLAELNERPGMTKSAARSAAHTPPRRPG
jgi:hypothetical protein